ncbi:hypothetical protein LTR33_013752 [Friedmanniomyces endolithicus]|nr:hypothetical protein LTR33_013752 [Friedmanniomyces endolithicus]
MLRPDEWKPPNKIADVLKLVRAVLASPQPDDAVEQGIADQYKNDRKAFDKTAKDWVNRWWSGGQGSAVHTGGGIEARHGSRLAALDAE